jgi:hypothetical protein
MGPGPGAAPGQRTRRHRLPDDGRGDFLVLLVDLATGEAPPLSYRKGRATEPREGDPQGEERMGRPEDPRVRPRITAEWDGESLLEAVDPNPAAGRSGMATAGPGVVSFDEFILDPAAELSRYSRSPQSFRSGPRLT